LNNELKIITRLAKGYSCTCHSYLGLDRQSNWRIDWKDVDDSFISDVGLICSTCPLQKLGCRQWNGQVQEYAKQAIRQLISGPS